jgi:DNA-binding MarR family transcriptional regulator
LLLQERHSLAILLLLNENGNPLTTNGVIDSLGLKNWTRATKTLSKLEEANLVVRAEGRLGRHSSRAVLWRLEPEGGVKVVQALKEAERLIDLARSKKKKASFS